MVYLREGKSSGVSPHRQGTGSEYAGQATASDDAAVRVPDLFAGDQHVPAASDAGVAGHRKGHDERHVALVNLGQGAVAVLALDPLALVGQPPVGDDRACGRAVHENVAAAYKDAIYRLAGCLHPGDANARDNEVGLADDGDVVRGQVDKCCHVHTP